MAIKESSDELNPTVVTAEVPAGLPRPTRSWKNYFALAIATFGVGYLPLAPGTYGSLVAVGFYLCLRVAIFGGVSNSNATANPLLHWAFLVSELLIISTVTVLGVWAASRTERVLRIKDPGIVVVDEVSGQFIALLAVPLVIDRLWWVWLSLAFFLFRFFDIVKPYPARRLESLHGGLGIMADDLVAGAYAALVVALLVSVRWFM